jgi:hypothetical protein
MRADNRCGGSRDGASEDLPRVALDTSERPDVDPAQKALRGAGGGLGRGAWEESAGRSPVTEEACFRLPDRLQPANPRLPLRSRLVLSRRRVHGCAFTNASFGFETG